MKPTYEQIKYFVLFDLLRNGTPAERAYAEGKLSEWHERGLRKDREYVLPPPAPKFTDDDAEWDLADIADFGNDSQKNVRQVVKQGHLNNVPCPKPVRRVAGKPVWRAGDIRAWALAASNYSGDPRAMEIIVNARLESNERRRRSMERGQ